MKDDPSVKIEKDVDEYLVNKVFGCQLVITNISIANLNLQLLFEVPNGAIPVNTFEYTKSTDLNIASYQSKMIEYFFYFPKEGCFSV